MLKKLYIRNYAIIDELTIEFDSHLNVITGETGAGKSIILGALSLILGERADTSVLIDTDNKCIVEAWFDTARNDYFNQLLQAEDIDRDDITIIRREISASGKSRAFVNDTPVTLSVLHALTAMLVDLHRQFDTRDLLAGDFATDVLDAIGRDRDLLHRYQDKYRAYRAVLSEFHQLEQKQQGMDRDVSYKQFLYDELKAAHFQADEIEQVESELKVAENAEQIAETLKGTADFIENQDNNVSYMLKKLVAQLRTVPDYTPGVILADRLDSACIELQDIAAEASGEADKIELDPERLNFLQERLDLGYKLFKKHSVRTTAELLDIQEKLETELAQQQDAGARLEALQAALEEAQQSAGVLAAELSAKRKKEAEGLCRDTNRLLALVGMPNAVFSVSIQPAGNLHQKGKDTIEFLLDANKSGRPQPITKGASGGELSRIMLCLKSLTAEALELPTLIFDEVDTGISGEAARQVAVLLHKLGRYHQVICITHQPQVAGKGNTHYFVYKQMEEGKVLTRVRILDAEERIASIAGMIGGAHPSEAAIASARELLEIPDYQ